MRWKLQQPPLARSPPQAGDGGPGRRTDRRSCTSLRDLPATRGFGGFVAYRRIGEPSSRCATTSFSPGRLPASGEPDSRHRRNVLLFRVRTGASSNARSNTPDERTASFSLASTIRSRYAGSLGVLSATTNLVPIHAACAPRTSTAARPRPSPIPPAAITGVGETASTTVGSRTRVPMEPQTCPPASAPCATISGEVRLRMRR